MMRKTLESNMSLQKKHYMEHRTKLATSLGDEYYD